jgi:SulP family sulfate permease
LAVFGIVVDLVLIQKVGDIASIQGGFPPSHTQYTIQSGNLNFPYAVIMAGVGLIESLLTLNIIDEITETRGRGIRKL